MSAEGELIRNPMLDLIEEVGEVRSGTRHTKKLTCKLCRDIVFEAPECKSHSLFNAELVRLKAHFEIAHGISISAPICNDPNCPDRHE